MIIQSPVPIRLIALNSEYSFPKANSVLIGKKFELYHVKAADLEAGEWKATWLPTFDETLPPEKVKEMVIPFISGWALGIYNGIIDLEPQWNRRFPEIKFTSVHEMLSGAWEKAKAEGKA